MQILNQNYIYEVVKKALEEDLDPFGDITSKLIKNKKSKAKIIAKQKGVVVGLDFCKAAFKLLEKDNTVPETGMGFKDLGINPASIKLKSEYYLKRYKSSY